MGQPLGTASRQGARAARQVDARPRHPEREDERQAGQRLPGLGQVDHRVERLRRHLSSPDRRSRAPRRPCSPATGTPSGSGSISAGRTPWQASSQTLGQHLARPRALVQRQSLDPLQRHPAEELHAPHRPPGRDREPGDDLVAPTPPRGDTPPTGSGPVELSGRQAAPPAGWELPWSGRCSGANSQSL